MRCKIDDVVRMDQFIEDGCYLCHILTAWLLVNLDMVVIVLVQV